MSAGRYVLVPVAEYVLVPVSEYLLVPVSGYVLMPVSEYVLVPVYEHVLGTTGTLFGYRYGYEYVLLFFRSRLGKD